MSTQPVAETKQNNPLYLIITLLVMLASAVLAIADIEAGINIFYAIFALFSKDASVAALYGSTAIFLLGIAALALIVITFEYHMRHVWQRTSFKLFAITLAVQVALVVIGFVIL